MENRKRTAIIVLNYNDAETTIKFIEQVKNYDSLDFIVVVDNASKDNSVESLSPYIGGKVELVRSTQNKGYAYGNNLGLRYVEKYHPECNYYIVSNPDIIISNNSICELIEQLQKKEDIVLATGVIKDVEGKKVSNCGWYLPSARQILLNSFFITYFLINKVWKQGIYVHLNDKKKEPVIVEAVPGCFFVIKAQAMQQIGFFDEDTFLFCEENILGSRLKENKYKSMIVPWISLVHENSVTISKSIKRSYDIKKLLLQSYLVYLKKYRKMNKLSLIWFSILYRISFFDDIIVHKVIKLKTIFHQKEKNHEE